MNRAGHAIAGGMVAAVGYFAFCKICEEPPDLRDLLGLMGMGAAAACIHDVLEPALHPNHRAFVHSLALNAALAIGTREFWLNSMAPLGQKILWTTLELAFLSHPVLDAATPKGLPIC